MAEGRSLNVIAAEIKADWLPVGPYARDYVTAMSNLRSVDDDYYHDTGRSIVRYFLANAQNWRGEKARQIKAELNRLLED